MNDFVYLHHSTILYRNGEELKVIMGGGGGGGGGASRITSSSSKKGIHLYLVSSSILNTYLHSICKYVCTYTSIGI